MTPLIALLLAAAPAMASGSPPTSARQVTVPLDEFERLRKLEERPSLTVVDLLRVEGSFAKRDLSVTFTGRAAGTWPTAEVLSAEGARLHSCQGDALVSRGESGAFALTPLAARFQVRCRVALDGSDRLAGQATGAVLEVAAAVPDGELVASGEGGERAFSVVRRIAGGEQEDLPPAVTGRYLVTLLPEESRFVYRLEVRNPARGHRSFEVALRGGERVESVDAPVAWDTEGARYRFDLPPGETALALTGRLTQPSFRAPVDASLQYLLVESHPLIRPDVKTGAKRVGLGETGLTPRFRGAQAFLLGGDVEVAWTATRLTALKTAGLALHGLRQVFFLGTDGVARGEATLAVDNQGAPTLALPTVAQPTFASVGGEPAFLTRDRDGRLSLPLAQGPQEVVVQDAQPFWSRMGLAVARLELPRPGMPASSATVELRYPAEWIPLYEELPPHSRAHLLGLGVLASLAVILLGAERLLALSGVSRGRRWLLGGALALAAAFSDGGRALALALVFAPLIALGAVSTLRRLRGAARVAAVVAGLLGLALVLLVATVALELPGGAPREEGYDASSRDLAMSNQFRAPVSPSPAKGKLALDEKTEEADRSVAQAASAGGSGYEGLPARIELPAGARRSVFTRELLSTDTSRKVLAVAVAARLVALLGSAALLLLLALALAFRRDLAAGAQAYAARLRASPAARGGTAAAPGP